MEKNFLRRLVRLIFGLFLYALGSVLSIRANIGYAPWDVFHVGLSKTIGISIGQASIFTGFIIIFFVYILKEKLGLGTILNMVLIGTFTDMIISLNIIPELESFSKGLIQLLIALLISVFSIYFYISSGFGAGPRDSLMVALSRRLNISSGKCRIFIETFAISVGWLLGGKVGIGSIISVFGVGILMDIIFSMLNFDPRKIKHETIDETIKNLK